MKYRTVLIAAFAAIVMSTVLGACKESIAGPATTVTRPLSGFTRIDVEDGFDVEIRKDVTEDVTIEAPEGAMAHIITVVEGNRLRVYVDDIISSMFSPRRIIIRVRSLEEIELSGGTELTGVGTFDAPNFTLGASGGSNATLTIAATRTEVQASGGSVVSLRGSTDILDIESYSGGGRFHGFDLNARVVELDASGGSRLDVRASERLDVSASGGCEINYKGRPAITSDLTGGSTIIDAN